MASVRAATEQDIPRILELYAQLATDPDTELTPLSPEEMRAAFAEMRAVPGYELLVAETDGEIVATTVLAVLPGFAYHCSPFAVVEYVVVDDKERRKGIGRELMEAVIERARKAGCYKIMLTSDSRRDAAHAFYESLGFEASARGYRLYFPSTRP
jgi:GNAT superfamily N-acetyltransferase